MPDDEATPDEAEKQPDAPGEGDGADDGVKDGGKDGGKQQERRRLRPQVVVPAVALLVGLALFAVSLGVYIHAERQPDYAADASVRNEVQVAANHAVEVLNTLDYRDLDAGLEAWASVSTGDLQSQLTDLTDQQRQALTKVAGISEGTVQSSAVTRLDAEAGTASVICFVEKSTGQTPAEVDQGAPSRIQFTVDLREESGTWLVSTLTPVSVTTPEGEEAQ